MWDDDGCLFKDGRMMKGFNLEYILKIVLMGFVDGLDIRGG